jgi:hypothetical protein
MKFVQIIEYTTTRPDDVTRIMDEWMAATEGVRTPSRALLGRDRDRPDTYIEVVEFPSYEAAMRNNDLPETTKFSQQMMDLCTSSTFRNLDLVREETL